MRQLDAIKSFSKTRLEKYPLLQTVNRSLKSLSHFGRVKMNTVFRNTEFSLNLNSGIISHCFNIVQHDFEIINNTHDLVK